MSDAHGTETAHAADPHAPGGHDTGHDAPHGDAHGDEHGGHGHDGIQLGGIDWAMWLTGAIGILAGLVVVAAFVMATAGVE